MASDIYSLIAREYGVDGVERVDGEEIVAAAAAVRFWRQDPRRVAFTFINLSANSLGILPGDGIAANRQITVAPNGGSATVNWRNDLHLPAMEWFVLGTAAAEAFMVIGVRLTGSVETP